MGFKAVKQAYQIGHIVHVRDGNLCIGSDYISEIIVVRPDGKLAKAYDARGTVEKLHRWQGEIAADPARFAELFAAPDVFLRDLKAYRWDEAAQAVVFDLCEERGYPNCTHDGKLMHDNSHFETVDEAAAYALKLARSGFRSWARVLQETRDKVVELTSDRDVQFAEILKLERDFPHLVESPTPTDVQAATDALGCVYSHGDGIGCFRKVCPICHPAP